MDTQKLLNSVLCYFLLSLLSGQQVVQGHLAHHHHHSLHRQVSNTSKLFVFGDSYADTGNTAKSNSASWKDPYGITFPGKPTGRSSDGRVLTDYVAKSMGIRSPIPYRWRKFGIPLLKYGMNFAYGGMGVFETLKPGPNMTTQIDFFQNLITDNVFNISDIQSSVTLVTLSGNDYRAYIGNHGIEVDMAPNQRMGRPGEDFWTPIDRTPSERPVVGSDDTTQDPNETQGGVDAQYVLHERPVVGSNDTTQDPNETQGAAHSQHIVHDQPVVGSDETTQDPNETQGVVDSEQCVAPDMEFGSSAQSVPETSQHSGTTRVPRILRDGKVYTIDEQGRKNVRTVGSPKDIWHIPDGEKVVIEFNLSYQPTGPGVEKFRRICGKIIRSGKFVQLHGNWRTLPLEGKEDMWRTLTQKFYFEPIHLLAHIKRLTLMDLAKKRRQHRYEVKRSLKLKQGDTVQSVVSRASPAPVFDAEDFEMQVETWLSSADKERALKSKISRGQNALLHTLGSKSIAQVAREMEEDIGETPNRDDMFIVSHTKKDGNPVNAAAGETIEKKREIIINQSPAERVCSQGSIYWSHNDACAQVLGREHPGRVRGVGLGPTPGKSTSYTSGQGSISSGPTPKEQEMAAEMERLKTLYEAQQEELAAVKRMVALIMAEKQSSMGNNEEANTGSRNEQDG